MKKILSICVFLIICLIGWLFIENNIVQNVTGIIMVIAWWGLLTYEMFSYDLYLDE